jgi:hypothetical protein
MVLIPFQRRGDARENRAALNVHLTKHDFAILDREFPPPTGPQPLEML